VSFSLTWKLASLIGFRFWDAFFGACDGNFKLRRTKASSDAKDPSLYDGLAYFVPLQKFKDWLIEKGDIRQEVNSLRYPVSLSLILFCSKVPVYRITLLILQIAVHVRDLQ
jgi:hypothetical protein